MNIAVITPVKHINGLKELLSKKGSVHYCEQGSKKEVRKVLLKNKIDTIICNPNKQDYKIDRELLQSTSVKLINTCSTGLNHIDVEYCQAKGIEILSLKEDFELLNKLPSTSELALALTLAILRKLPASVKSVTRNEWDYTPYIGRMCSELTIGIIGYGRLGKMMADFCKPLFKQVLIYDPYSPSSYYFNVSTLEEAFECCDVLSLHVHVNEETKYMINEELLAKSKRNPYIVNTSRGEIVDEKAVVEAIKEGLISGYAADVIEDEFGTIENSPIVRAMTMGYNIIVTPHTGGMTQEGQELAFKWAVNKLDDYEFTS